MLPGACAQPTKADGSNPALPGRQFLLFATDRFDNVAGVVADPAVCIECCQVSNRQLRCHLAARNVL